MAFRVITISLAVIVVISAKHLESRVFHENLGAYDANIGRFFRATEAVENEKHLGKREDKVCQTDACKILGKEFRWSMNTSVDPCVNFYDYVCGGWKNRLDLIPPYERGWGRSALLQHTVYKRIKYILETEPEPTDILPVRQAKKWYGACMDKEEREKRGIKPIESILMQTGGWPLAMDLVEWSEDDFSWQDVERNYFYITGEFTFYILEPTWIYNGERSVNKIGVEPSRMPLDVRMPDVFRHKSKKEDWSKYTSFLKRVVKVFIRHSRANVLEETIDKDIEDLVAFEKKLFKILNLDEDSADLTILAFVGNYTTNVTDIPEEFHIDFVRIFDVLSSMGNLEFDLDTELWISSPSYLPLLTKLLSETPKRTIANYVHWNFVSRAVFYTTEEMQTIWNEEMKEDVGITAKPPRWLQCVRDLRLDQASTYAFATKYYTESTDKAVRQMIENVRQQLTLLIENANWMTNADRAVLNDKLKTIKLYVGFPDWYKNDTAVKAIYKGLKIGYDYFENVLNFDKYKIREKLRFMKEKKKAEPWDVEPIVVNAAYSILTNVLSLPAADLQYPFFSPGLPENLNYGIIGTTVGHEMGHAYDDTGIRYNKDGQIANLTNQMVENYYKRAECFLHQYDKYYGVTEPVYEGTTPMPGQGSIGRQTRGENIADATGLDAVFETWKKFKVSNGRGEEDKLPGFEDFTDEQMFFIAFGGAYCTVEKPEFLEELKKDVHSVSNVRVIGAVSNSKAFAQVFKCSQGSPMNPENKCNVWKEAEESNEIPLRRRLHGHHRRSRSRWALD